jgi:hypothetical protein
VGKMALLDGPGQFCVTGVQRPTVAIADRFRPRHRYRRRQLASSRNRAHYQPRVEGIDRRSNDIRRIGSDQPAK